MELNRETSAAAGNAPAVEPPVLPARRVGRVRWWMHLLVLTAYPLVVGLLSSGAHNSHTDSALSKSAMGLLRVSGVELAIVSAVFIAAWLFSRATADDLLLRWRGGVRPILFGIGYSVALRILVAIVAFGFVLAAVIGGADATDAARKMRPEFESIVDVGTLGRDPLYFALLLTLVSFGVAGLREELWRAGMLAGLAALFPKLVSTFRGKLAAVAVVALVFGLGHLLQGWGGVVFATVLGLGLGAIMVFHRSIWEAVLAHGFFNATSFALLYLLARLKPDFLQEF